jgi:hypothetical protein
MKFWVSLLCIFLSVGWLHAQKPVYIQGKLIYRNANVVAANVINNTAQLSTITDSNGAFEILVNLGDELVFSSVQYTIKTIKITPEILRKKRLIVSVNEKIQALEEIVITPEDTEQFMNLKNEEFKGYDYKQDKSTRITNAAMDEPRLTNGLNIVNIAKLAMQLMQGKTAEERKNLKPSRVLPYLFEDRFFTETLSLPKDQITGFLEYIDQQLPTQDLLNKSKEFELIDYLINESENYQSQI